MKPGLLRYVILLSIALSAMVHSSPAVVSEPTLSPAAVPNGPYPSPTDMGLATLIDAPLPTISEYLDNSPNLTVPARRWFKWVATFSGKVQFQVVWGQPEIWFFRLTESGPAEISRENASPDVASGETYYILVLSRSLPDAYYFFLQSPGDAPRPGNDDQAQAVNLGSDATVLIEGTTLGATREPGEPGDTNAIGAVWYTWTPSVSGGVHYQIETGRPNIWVFTGNVQVARNGNNFFAQAGISYRIGVYRSDAVGGPFRFLMSSATAPVNDGFAQAIELHEDARGVVDVSGFLWGATRQTNEPAGPGNAADVGSIWYKWIPQTSGRVRYVYGDMGTIGRMQVFLATGSDLSSLEKVAGEDERPYLFAGNTYYLAAYGNAYAVRFTIETATAPPQNDNFGNAISIQLTNRAAAISGTTFGATREPDEPYAGTSVNSVWYRFVPTSSGPVAVGLRWATHHVQVFQASENSFAGLLRVATNYQSTRFETGATYYISVSSTPLGYEPFDLQLSVPARPANDDFESATALGVIDRGLTIATVSTMGATFEPAEPIPAGTEGSTWYSFRPVFPSRAETTVFGGSTPLRLYSGSSVSTLTPVIPPEVYPNTTYYLAAYTEGAVGSLSSVFIGLSPIAATNDNFSQAIALEGYAIRAFAPMSAATSEPGEPDVDSAAEKTLWWRWTAPVTGTLNLNALLSSQASVVIRIYSGDNISSLSLLAKGQGTFSFPVFEGETLNLSFAAPVGDTGTLTFTGLLGIDPDRRKTQMIDFPPLPDVQAGADPIPLIATTTSGLPISYSVRFGPAVIETNLLRITGGGLVSVAANQAGDETWWAADEVVRNFTVTKLPQQITFDPFDVETESVVLNASASSGLGIVFAVLSGNAELTGGNVLTNIGAGPITVEASQPGNDRYAAAESVKRTFTLNRFSQVIDLLASPERAISSAGLTAFSVADASSRRIELAARASSGLPVTLSVISGPGVLQRNLLTVTGPGAVVVQASQSGDSIFAPAILNRSFGAARAELSVGRANSKLVVRWTAPSANYKLQAAKQLPGHWTDLSAALSGFEVEPTDDARFFRLIAE